MWKIFMYAGNTVLPTQPAGPNDQNLLLDAVYVLTLPSFTWFKSNYAAAQARFAHSCNMATNDSRQMIVVGGYQYYDNNAFYYRDIWTQGLAGRFLPHWTGLR